MIGDGQWVTTRDEKSVNYFLATIRMQDELRRARMARRRQFWSDVWYRVARRYAAATMRNDRRSAGTPR